MKPILTLAIVAAVVIIVYLIVKQTRKEGYDGMVKISGPYGTDGGKYIGKKFANFGCGDGSAVPCELMTPDDYGKLSQFKQAWMNMVLWQRMAGIDGINQGGLTLNGFVAPLRPVLTTMGETGGVPGGNGSNDIGLTLDDPIPSPGTIGLRGSTVPLDETQVKNSERIIADVYSHYYDTGDSTATSDKLMDSFMKSNEICKLVLTDIFQGYDTTPHMDMWREWCLDFAEMVANLAPQYYTDSAAKNALVQTIYTAMVDHVEMVRDQFWQYNNGNHENSLDIFEKLQGQTQQFGNMLFELIIKSTN